MSELTATPVMLGAIPFFQDVGGEGLEKLAPQFQLRNLRRGEHLAGRGFQRLEEYQEQVYFVYKGVVAAFTVTRLNSRKILFFLGPGKLLNHNIFNHRPATIYAEAMTDAILLSIPRNTFAAMIARSPILTQAVLAHYETNLWRMSHQLKNTAGYVSVERKLAIKLLKLSQDFGVPSEEGLSISFPLTITQVAEFVGIPRETASRACKKLTEMGMIVYKDRYFSIPDKEKLVAYYRAPSNPATE